MSFTKNLKRIIASGEGAVAQRAIEAANAKLVQARTVTPGSVFTVPALSNVSIQYANPEYIGEKLMPVVYVPRTAATYYKFGKADRLTSYDDKIGPRGTPNEVTENRTKENISLEDYALTNYVDNEVLRQQDRPLNEMVDLVDAISDNLALNSEIRHAAALTTAANYSGNTDTLSGTSQWNDVGLGNPVANMLTATDSLATSNGPSEIVAFMGPDVWNTVRSHPAILDLFKYGGQSLGLASEDMVAKFFSWSKLYVGRARKQTANENQAPTYSYIWGKHFGVIRVASNPGVRTAAFGYTFRLQGDPKTDIWYRPEVGKSGGYQARVGHSEGIEIVAPDAGFLYRDAVS